jgi:DNA polymerase-3 subunit beta
VNFNIPKKDILETLTVAGKVLPKNGAVPELENINLELTGSQLVAKATNLEVEVISKRDFDTTAALSVLLPPNFMAVVNSLPSSDVSFEFKMNGENSKVLITGGAAKFTLGVGNADSYPQVEELSPEGKVLTFTEKELREIVGQAVVCVSADESRPVFQAVAFDFGQDKFEVLASDTYRLSRRIEELPYGDRDIALVPGKSLEELIRLLGNGESSVSMFYQNNRVVFKGEKFYFAARVITEKFPDISGVIPGEHKTQAILPVKELTEAVKRVALISEGKNRAIKLTLDKDGLHLFAESQMGEANERLEFKQKEGEDVELHINARFLLDAVSVAAGENVRLCLNGSAGPVVIYNAEDNNWLCLILPVKMN